MKQYAVGRHIGGIALNDYEYLLDENGELILFDSAELAKEYLRARGYTESDMYWLIFEKIEL